MLLQRNYLNSHFLHIKETESEDGRNVITMRMAEEVTFLNKGAIKKEFDNVPPNCIVIIDKSSCVFMNHDLVLVLFYGLSLYPMFNLITSVRYTEIKY